MLMVNCLLFRFDAPSGIGLGHAFRCMALIEHLSLNSSKGEVTCVVISKYLPEFLTTQLLTMQVKIIWLANDDNTIEEITQISVIKARFKALLIVLDGYQFDESYREQLAKLSITIVAFDDTNELSHLHCDVVINALPFADILGYQNSAPLAQHLLGLQYSIVRQEFLSSRTMPFNQREKLLINFGGSDVGGLTLPIIEQVFAGLLSILPENVVVVTGGGCTGVSKINTFCARVGYQHIHQCNYMAELLNQCKMAICAPGAIVYELAYCKVPSVFLTVADNQILSAKAHQFAGWSFAFNGLNANDINEAIIQVKNLWHNTKQLTLMSDAASKLVDGQGVSRIIEKLKEQIAC